jgi:phosphoesterase RecJ-like protein
MINLVDDQMNSVGEILYLVINDWGVDINKKVATDLLTGIIGDTGAFRFPGSTEKTFKIAEELMRRGADKDKIVFHIYRSEPFNLIKFYGEVLSGLNLDSKGKFVWIAIPYEKYKTLGKPAAAKESAASLFAQIVEGTEFGFIAVETEKDKLAVSFRSRTGFDTSTIAMALGGGGHIYASACKVEGLAFDKAVKKVLAVARKYAKKSKK